MASGLQTMPARGRSLLRADRFALAAILAVAATAAFAQPQAWDMATSAGPDTSQARATQNFVANLSARTEGQFTIVAHAAQALMKPPEIKDAVRRGVVPMGEFALSLHAGESPIYGLDSLPLVATGYVAARKLYDAQRPALEKRLAEEGLKLLYSAPYLAQGLCADRAVIVPSDLKGMRLRTYNHATKKLALLTGAIPVTVDTPDIPAAMAARRIDGFIASSGQAATRKAWVFAPYFHTIAMWVPRNAVVANKAQFEALPAEVRKAMLDAAKFAEDRAWEAAARDDAERQASLARSGAAIVPASSAFIQAMNDVGRQIADEWLKVAGADGQAIFDAYRKSLPAR